MKIQPFLPWSQLMENNKPRWTNLQERLFLFPLPPRGTVLPCQGPWLKTVNLNSHRLPEPFSTALSTTHLGLSPRPLATGDLHQLLLLREGSVCGLCSSSWSSSLDLAGCMQISVNTAICPLSLPTTAEPGLREAVLAQASHSACHLSHGPRLGDPKDESWKTEGPRELGLWSQEQRLIPYQSLIWRSINWVRKHISFSFFWNYVLNCSVFQ